MQPSWRDGSDYPTSHAYPSRPAYVVTALSVVGDWVILRELSRAPASYGYFAVARLVAFDRDASLGMHVARFADFLAFPSSVGLKLSSIYAESQLRTPYASRSVGQAFRSKAVRTLREEEFALIVHAGFAKSFGLEENGPDTHASQTSSINSFEEPFTPFDFEPRKLGDTLSNRLFRDKALREVSGRVYQWTCAVTGDSLHNKRGDHEVHISHIQPVAQHGPDVVQNTIALSQTPHWLFDQLVFTIGIDNRLILAPVISDTFRERLPPDGRLRWPLNTGDWPSRRFLDHHRQRFATEWNLPVETLFRSD